MIPSYAVSQAETPPTAIDIDTGLPISGTPNSVNIPSDLQNDQEFYGSNESLRQQRGNLNTKVSDMESGSYSIKKLFTQ